MTHMTATLPINKLENVNCSNMEKQVCMCTGQCHAGTQNKRRRGLSLYLDTASLQIKTVHVNNLYINLLVQSQ